MVPFFLEYDTGTERPLTRLVDKLDGYRDLAQVTGRLQPVLFWLPTAARERLRAHRPSPGTDPGVGRPGTADGPVA